MLGDGLVHGLGKFPHGHVMRNKTGRLSLANVAIQNVATRGRKQDNFIEQFRQVVWSMRRHVHEISFPEHAPQRGVRGSIDIEKGDEMLRDAEMIEGECRDGVTASTASAPRRQAADSWEENSPRSEAVCIILDPFGLP
jgi:hypothetical protein